MERRILASVISLALLMGCATQEPVQTAAESPPACSAAENQAGVRVISPTDLQVGSGRSTAVISSAQKFIIPVPALGAGGEPLIYPEGAEKAGGPILDYEGNPIGDLGIVFFNAKDRAWQAAKGDGEAVIIINEVTAEQADKLYQKVAQFQLDPNDLTLAELKQVIAFAQETLGLVDMYNSSRSFIEAKMTPAIADQVPTANGQPIDAYGFKKRDDRDINQAIYIPGEFVFEGPSASPQEFADGGVIVEQGGKMRGVQPDIFVRTYKFSDGQAIAAPTNLATQCS